MVIELYLCLFTKCLTEISYLFSGAGHIADFFSYSGYDTEEVRFAKRLVADHIRRFLNDAKK